MAVDSQASPNAKKEAIYQALHLIPRGKVVSYGQLAKLAGLGKAARFVGTTLKALPPGSTLPWHRVIKSNGEIAFPKSHPGRKKQLEKLNNEGVFAINGKIDLRQYRLQSD